jgi:5-methylcytosine-specific restriction endonuclease McrA
LERNPEKRAESLLVYNNKPETKARISEWHKNNADRVRASRRKWAEANKDKATENSKRYAKENPGWKAAHCAKRRSCKLKALPAWLTQEELDKIEGFYQKAKRLFKETGIPHHVDHIIPLQGKYVSGLHVPWNLQILTASENSKKSNKYENL